MDNSGIAGVSSVQSIVGISFSLFFRDERSRIGALTAHALTSIKENASTTSTLSYK
jgi:hypothetical protein